MALPFAGNRNGSSFNNVGSNGNYWSSTPNDSNNAWNANFNSDNANMNNDNRNNGYSVRLVSVQNSLKISFKMSYSLTYEQLRADLHDAFLLAKKHKSTRLCVREYEKNLDKNLDNLAIRLYNRTYKPFPCYCFPIDSREVFAAQFEDRIVHHLYYEYTHILFERTFIHDSFSCIKGRGIHEGVRRYREHIREESRNYTRKCYVLTLDIRGYFMHINRSLLCRVALDSLERMRFHRVKKHLDTRWDDVLDFGFLGYLTELFCMYDALEDCIVKGSLAELETLPRRKRLRYSPKGSGLPIGNLTSQLFSNIFLNLLDQFVKRTLKARHYCRYVDDARIISSSKAYLRYCLKEIASFLQSLNLDLQMTKVHIADAYKGTSFCGAFLLPFRDYVSTSTKNRISRKVLETVKEFDEGKIGLEHFVNSMQSFVGTLSHYRTYNIQRRIFGIISG